MPSDVVLSTKTFIISHTAILLIALLFFAGLYYILYQDKFQAGGISYNPVTKEPVALFLEIGTPEDDILAHEDNVLVTGKTGSGDTVIISSNSFDSGLQASKDGQFSKVIDLAEGPNLIEITAFDNEGNSKTVTKSVYFSKEKLP